MFRAPLCPSSGAQEYYTVVAACGISFCGFQVAALEWSSTLDQQLENHSTKYHRQQPLYNTLELLMMDIVMPETCWASSNICNKNLCCIYLAFYFHILTTMHGQNHIKFIIITFPRKKLLGKALVCSFYTSSAHLFNLPGNIRANASACKMIIWRCPFSAVSGTRIISNAQMLIPTTHQPQNWIIYFYNE